MRPFELALTTAFVSALAACGPKETDRGVIEGNNATNNGGTNNGTANNGSNNGANNGSNNGGSNNGVDSGCPMVEEFSNESIDVEREFHPSSSVEGLTCAQDIGEIATDGAYVARLQYSMPTDVTISVLGLAGDGGTPPRPAIELRRGSCDGGSVELCDSTPEATAQLEADTPYYLIVNGLLSSGGVALTVEPEGGACVPGETTCSGGMVDLCTSTGGTRDIMCPGECAGDLCAGDTCADAISIAPTPGGDAIAVQGNRVTFSNTWTGDGLTGCATIAGEPPDDTPGPEFFLRVQGVNAGDRVVFDATNANGRYGFYVLNDCTATQCAGAYQFDQNDLNRGEHLATADGDVLVAVEAFGPDLDREFNILVSVE